jgi:hypothetical protein
VSLQREFGSGSCFVFDELILGHGFFYHANDFDATKLLLVSLRPAGQNHRAAAFFS